MQNFRINPEGYTMPEPESRWTYTVGSKVLFVDYQDEPMKLNVRFA